MHYAIGDVHGCYTKLLELLDKINYDPSSDTLWFVGDLVNRGPDSRAVINFVRQCPASTIVLLGNHDLHLLAVAFGQASLHKNDTISEILNADDRDEIVDFMRQQKLFHYDEELDFAMVHAGIPPQWSLSQTQRLAKEVETILKSEQCELFFKHMYGDDPNCWDEQLAGWSRYRLITNYLTRMRFCDEHGQLDLQSKAEIGSQPKNMHAWFDCPNRQLQHTHIVFGHWAALAGKVTRHHCYAIDGGCVWGGSLMALCLQTRQRFAVSNTKRTK